MTTPSGVAYVENLSLVVGQSIPNTIRVSDDGTYDSYAFRFNTGSSAASSGLFRTVRYDGSSSNREVAISAAPGVFTALNGNVLCAVGVSLRDTSTRWVNTASTSSCALQPNTTYYLNVRSAQNCTAGTQAACRFTLSGSSTN